MVYYCAAPRQGDAPGVRASSPQRGQDGRAPRRSEGAGGRVCFIRLGRGAGGEGVFYPKSSP